MFVFLFFPFSVLSVVITGDTRKQECLMKRFYVKDNLRFLVISYVVGFYFDDTVCVYVIDNDWD